MKCTCQFCKGSGMVDCDDCGGSGERESAIEAMTLTREMHNYPELKELQKDAKRIHRDTIELTRLNPSRADSYREQRDGALRAVNALAEKALKVKCTTKSA